MKRTRRIIGLLLLAVGAVVLGVSQFLSLDERSNTTDMVTGAVSVVAGAANRIAADNRMFTVEVATRMGRGRVDERDEQMSVMATIAVRGGYGLYEMCSSLPRVRDAINAVAADRIGPRVRAGYRIVADDLVDDGRAVMATLNHVVQSDIVTGVRLVVRPARFAQESGCD